MYFETIKMASNRKTVRFWTDLCLIEVQPCSDMGITFRPRRQPIHLGVERDRENRVMVAVSGPAVLFTV